MKQPRKLHPNIAYSHDAAVPEIDNDLKDFLTIHHEGLDSYTIHGELDENHVGETVFLNEEKILEENQFEDYSELN